MAPHKQCTLGSFKTSYFYYVHDEYINEVSVVCDVDSIDFVCQVSDVCVSIEVIHIIPIISSKMKNATGREPPIGNAFTCL